MAEKIIQSVNLYDNTVTEVKGDYVGKPVVTATLHNGEASINPI